MALPKISSADTITVNPTDDGSLYTCSGCNPAPSRDYVLASGYIVGDVDFSTGLFKGDVANAEFSVNPYGLPLWGSSVNVYGFASTSSTISMADLASPTFLGTWVLPSNIGYGQDAFFNVTQFLQGVNTPYVDIILISPNGTDVFSSLQSNYGHPSQLTVTTPESSVLAFLVVAFALFIPLYRNRRVFSL